MTLHAGFDIGGTNARLAVYDQQWELVSSGHRRIRGATRPEALADTMSEMLVEALDGASATVGIGLAAQLDKTGEVVINAPNLGWRHVPFAEVLRGVLGGQATSLRIVNDLTALVWGERVNGAVQEIDDVLAVYVGTGVGGAIIADGRLVEGASGKAGEIGHAKVVVGGRLCGCGERGCVEAYAGGRHLEDQVFALDIDGLVVDDRVDLGAADMLARDQAELNDLWVRISDYLAITIANSTTLLNPSVLLLGGGILSNLAYLRELTLRKVTPLVLAAAREDLDIRFGMLGDDAGVLGAAALAEECG